MHRIRKPAKEYPASSWTDRQATAEETLIPGKHYILNEPCLKKREGIIMFASGSTLFDEVPDWYSIFRHSYVLVRRTVRVVPCLVGPVPKNRDSKQRRAYIFSVYLRPWTWSRKIGRRRCIAFGRSGIGTASGAQQLEELLHEGPTAFVPNRANLSGMLHGRRQI